MRRLILGGFLALGAFALLSQPLPAGAVMILPPGPERIARLDAIVIGRVVALEAKDVEAPAAAKAPKTTYRIAVISVTDVLKGAKDQKTVRLGFIPPPVIQPGKPGVFGPDFRRFSPNFTVGQDGVFFLTKHVEGNFYLAPMMFDFVNSTSPSYAIEVKQTKLIIKLGDNLESGLKSKDAEERFLTAAILIQKYRNRIGRIIKSQPIDAGESKLILTAILEGDWKQNGRTSPWTSFNQLGLTPADGWTFPKAQKIEDFHKAAQDWLREHLATYRIQRIETAPIPGPGTQPGGPNRLPPQPPGGLVPPPPPPKK